MVAETEETGAGTDEAVPRVPITDLTGTGQEVCRPHRCPNDFVNRVWSCTTRHSMPAIERKG